jgi:uncharacterized membrane protein
MSNKSIARVLGSALVLAALGCSSEQEVKQLSYADDVKPIMDKHCVSCHVSGQQGASQSGLVLDSYQGLMKGTKHGPVVVADSAVSSTLYRLVAGKADPSIRMPHGKEPLSAEEVETIKVWIDQGAAQN